MYGLCTINVWSISFVMISASQ
uniref:Uncharacterized protein n=1 Tax=Anguilla anguilla TaxID=7936 RepID=A0A0E9P5G8_ANGAN